MNARDAIATAALRWQMARELRLAAGAVKRRTDVAYKVCWTGDATARLDVASWSLRADAAVAETRRQERAAVRALAKACAKARHDMQAVEVLDAELETRDAATPALQPITHGRSSTDAARVGQAPFPQLFPSAAGAGSEGTHDKCHQQ